MSRTDLEQIKEQLKSRLDQLNGSVRQHQSDLALGVGASDHIDQAAHTADSAISGFLATHEAEEIEQINKALEAIEKGKYGICEGCGKAIPLGRLEALPFTTLCVACKSLEEKGEYQRPEDRSIPMLLEDSEAA